MRGELEVGNITTIRGNLTVYGTTPLGLYHLPSLVVVAATIAAASAAFCSSTTSRLSTAPAPGSQVPKLPREPSPVSKLPTNHPLSLIVHAGDVFSHCDGHRWEQGNKHCYKHFQNASTFDEARRTCSNWRGYLASLTSPEENGFAHDTVHWTPQTMGEVTAPTWLLLHPSAAAAVASVVDQSSVCATLCKLIRCASYPPESAVWTEWRCRCGLGIQTRWARRWNSNGFLERSHQ